LKRHRLPPAVNRGDTGCRIVASREDQMDPPPGRSGGLEKERAHGYIREQGVSATALRAGHERKAEIFNECVASNFVNHDLPGPTPGPEGFLQSFAMFEAAFPDLQVHLGEVLAAEDDKVITRRH